MMVNNTTTDHIYVRLKNLGVSVEKLKDGNLSPEELSILASSLEELTRHYQTLKGRLTELEN